MDISSSTTSVPRSVAGPTMNGGPADPGRKNRWRSPAQEKIYGQKLARAIVAARHHAGAAGGAIKDAADSALALTARGQTRWSRAILARQWRRRKLLLKVGGKIRRRRRPAVKPAAAAAAATGGLGEKKKGERVRERLRVLSRLVPGCRELAAPALLEEAADYVAALQMQVRAMRALADRFSAAAAIDQS